MKLIDIFTDFVEEHHPYSKDWGRERVKSWILWYMVHGFYHTVWHGEQLMAFGLTRPVRSVKMGKKDYLFDKKGNICFADVAIAKDPKAFHLLLSEGLKRSYSKCKKLAFRRGKYHQRISILPIEKILMRYT